MLVVMVGGYAGGYNGGDGGDDGECNYQCNYGPLYQTGQRLACPCFPSQHTLLLRQHQAVSTGLSP